MRLLEKEDFFLLSVIEFISISKYVGWMDY